MVIVIAEIQLNEGTRAPFLEEFHKIVPLVREEVGCIEYGPTIDSQTDIPAQIPNRPDVVTVVEKWESVETLKAHLVAEHMVAYRPKVKDYVQGSKLHILEPA
jgi:quinol monooxygenase YgiN